jgi:hypothetical protein
VGLKKGITFAAPFAISAGGSFGVGRWAVDLDTGYAKVWSELNYDLLLPACSSRKAG